MARRIRMIDQIIVRSRIQHNNADAELNIDLNRFEGQYERAQYELDTMVMQDMVSYMPMINGTFINQTRARSDAIAGSGYVYAAAPPYGRFLYKGKVMVDERTGSTYARKGAKKVLVSQYTGRTHAREELEFSKEAHPQASKEWFLKAKQRHGKTWERKMKNIAGGGHG